MNEKVIIGGVYKDDGTVIVTKISDRGVHFDRLTGEGPSTVTEGFFLEYFKFMEEDKSESNSSLCEQCKNFELMDQPPKEKLPEIFHPCKPTYSIDQIMEWACLPIQKELEYFKSFLEEIIKELPAAMNTGDKELVLELVNRQMVTTEKMARLKLEAYKVWCETEKS